MAAEPVVALMSIRPRFAQAILEGKKTVELRRVPLKRPVTHVVIYETGITGAIVGLFEVRRIVEQSPRQTWRTYNGTSGLTKKEFDAYFIGKQCAVAIEVGHTCRFPEPVPLAEIAVTRPPQSFMYLSSSHVGRFIQNPS